MQKSKTVKPQKAFDLLNATTFAAECVREVHKTGPKIFSIVEDAVVLYMKTNHPDLLKKVVKHHKKG